jgi:hypothetical protein
LTKVFNTGVGQIEVMVLPVESFSRESFGGKGFHKGKDFQVGDRDLLRVLSLVAILLGNKSSL